MKVVHGPGSAQELLGLTPEAAFQAVYVFVQGIAPRLLHRTPDSVVVIGCDRCDLK